MAPRVTVTQIHPVEAHSFLSFSPRIELCLSGQPGGRRSQRLLHLSPLLVSKPPQNNQTSLCPPWLQPDLPCPFTRPLHLHLCHLVMLCFFPPSIVPTASATNVTVHKLLLYQRRPRSALPLLSLHPLQKRLCFFFFYLQKRAQTLHEFWTLKIKKHLSTPDRWVGIKER